MQEVQTLPVLGISPYEPDPAVYETLSEDGDCLPGPAIPGNSLEDRSRR